MPKVVDKDPELVAKFVTVEDLDKFWDMYKKESETNELLTDPKYVENKLNNDLIRIVTFLEKYCKKQRKRHNVVKKIMELRIKSNSLLFPENNGYVWADPNIDALHMEYTDIANEQLLFLQKMAHGLREYVSNNYYDIDVEMKKELLCLYFLLQEVFSNISLQSYEKIQEINSAYRGFKYSSQVDIDIDVQFKYIEDKLRELGIYEEYMSYIEEKYGKEDKLTKKKIPNLN